MIEVTQKEEFTFEVTSCEWEDEYLAQFSNGNRPPTFRTNGKTYEQYETCDRAAEEFVHALLHTMPNMKSISYRVDKTTRVSRAT